MIDVKIISKDKLRDDAFIRELQKDLELVVRQKRAKSALAFYKALEHVEKHVPKQLVPLYRRTAVAALPLLDEKDVERLLKDDLNDVLQSGMRRRIRDRLLTLHPSARDKVKSRFLSLLEDNTTNVTDSGYGTTKEWMKHFRESKRAPEEFLRQSIESQSLDVDERFRLQELLNLVADLEASSLTKEGLEDEMVVRDKSGEFKVWSRGQLRAFVGEKQPVQDVQPPQAPPKKISPPPPANVPKQPAATGEKPVLKSKANFFFHTEDDDEIRAHAKRLAGMGDVDQGAMINRIVRSVISVCQLQFSDDAARTRFASIAETRLKEIRDSIETATMLRKVPEEGGMGYDEQLAQRIVGHLDSAVRDLEGGEEPSLVRQSATQQKGPTKPAHAHMPASSRPPVPKPPPIPKIDEKERMTREEKRKEVRAAIQEAKREEDRPRPPPIKRPAVRVDETRPRIDDIKTTKRTTGPLDELENMTLKDFQRLGKSTAESIEKIVEKLDILEDENFTQRLEGISAWRKSAIFKLYLMTGRESMIREMSIEDIIAERAKAGKETLSEEEFQAIADMNKLLRI